MEQTVRLIGCAPKTATVDRGYKGRGTVGETVVQILKSFPAKTTTRYKQQKLKQSFRRRAAIEPVISYLKADHRLSRNFYRGLFGDNINLMLSAAAFNFKRMMNIYKKMFFDSFIRLLLIIQQLLLSKKQAFQTPKMSF